MPAAERVLVTFGLDRLFHEIVAAAMSERGWRVLEFAQEPSGANRAVDVVLVFASAGSASVVQTVTDARAEFPGARVILLGGEASDSDIIRCIEAGVSAYVSSTQTLDELVRTVQMVQDNKTLCSGRVTELVLDNIGRITQHRGIAVNARLTQREAEILQLLSTGLSNKEIAGQLGIADNTVKNHVHHILEKLKVKNRHEASWIKSRLRQSFPMAG
jgi:two-component system nitrate/nitrite response regulator NarL